MARPSRPRPNLEEPRHIRHYLIFDAKVRIPHEDLTSAIDDYVEKLTGDRTTHASTAASDDDRRAL
jgi:hypothetical protein